MPGPPRSSVARTIFMLRGERQFMMTSVHYLRLNLKTRKPDHLRLRPNVPIFLFSFFCHPFETPNG